MYMWKKEYKWKKWSLLERLLNTQNYGLRKLIHRIVFDTKIGNRIYFADQDHKRKTWYRRWEKMQRWETKHKVNQRCQLKTQ